MTDTQEEKNLEQEELQEEEESIAPGCNGSEERCSAYPLY